MTPRGKLLGILTFVAIIVVVVNVEHLAQEHGWDSLLSDFIQKAKWMSWPDWLFPVLLFTSGGAVALWVNRLLPSDAGSDLDRSESLKIMDFQIDRNALRERNPKLSFWMIVYNGTTKELSLNNAIGSFIYQGDYPGNIECEIENQPIPSGKTFIIKIYQWISQEDAQQIIDASQEDNHISFGYSRIDVNFNCNNKIINLLIPNSLQFHIQQDWRVQPDHEFFRPTWQDEH